MTGPDIGVEAQGRPHQRVGWFELFYDLVIVAAVGNGAHLFVEDPTWENGAWIALTFFVMFALWLLTVLNNNLYPGDHPWRRVLVLVQMLALVVACLSIGRTEGLPDSMGFIALAVAFGTIALIFLLATGASGAHGADRRDAVLVAASTGIGGLVLVSGALFPEVPEGQWDPALLVLVAGLLIATLPAFTLVLGRLCRAGQIDGEHLSERIGQLVIIILGESFVSLVATLGGKPAIPNPFFFVVTFAVVFSIWTIYFSSVLPAGVPERAGRLRAWLALHWLLMFGAVGAASGFAALTVVSFSALDQGSASAWTPAPLLYVMVALAGLTWLSRTRRLVWLHASTAGVLLVLVLVRLTVSQEGSSWEIAVGALVVVGDAVASALIERPYRLTSSDGETQ